MDLIALQSTLRQFAAERDWLPFHTPKNLAMALMVEAAELAELFQWMTPEQSQAACTDRVTQERVADEVADVLLYLLQIADHTGIDLKRAVGRKLVKNASKHPPVRPGIASGASGPSRVATHVLVDWENVRPGDSDIRRLVPDVTDVWLFHGPEQKAVGARHASFGEQLTVVKTSRAGRNALDMHLSFYLGHIAARHPEARFVVVSNDQDYLPVLAHAVERGFAARLIGFDAAAAKVAARKTVSKDGPAGKVAVRTAAAGSVAAQTVTAQKAAVKRAAVKKATPAKSMGSEPLDGQAKPQARPEPKPQPKPQRKVQAKPQPKAQTKQQGKQQAKPSAKLGRKQEPDAPPVTAPAPAAAAAPSEGPARKAAAAEELHAKTSAANTTAPPAKTKRSPAKARTPAAKTTPPAEAAASAEQARLAKPAAAKTSRAKTPAPRKLASGQTPTPAAAGSPRKTGSGMPDLNKAVAHVMASLKTMSRPTRQARLLATVKSLLGATWDEQAVHSVLARLLASGKVSIDASGKVGYAL